MVPYKTCSNQSTTKSGVDAMSYIVEQIVKANHWKDKVSVIKFLNEEGINSISNLLIYTKSDMMDIKYTNDDDTK